MRWHILTTWLHTHFLYISNQLVCIFMFYLICIFLLINNFFIPWLYIWNLGSNKHPDVLWSLTDFDHSVCSVCSRPAPLPARPPTWPVAACGGHLWLCPTCTGAVPPPTWWPHPNCLPSTPAVHAHAHAHAPRVSLEIATQFLGTIYYYFYLSLSYILNAGLYFILNILKICIYSSHNLQKIFFISGLFSIMRCLYQLESETTRDCTLSNYSHV